MKGRDPLLSVEDVARLYGTGVPAVIDAVLNGSVSSLDRGFLIHEGRLDIPLIRRSWAEGAQRDSPGASRRVDDSKVHPALETLMAFLEALDDDDEDLVELLSSFASTPAAEPKPLLEAWQSRLSHLDAPDVSFGSGVYSLLPIEAVAIRALRGMPLHRGPVQRPTPASLVDVLPLVVEDGEWKVDLGLYDSREDWMPLLSTPLPAEDGPSSWSPSRASSSTRSVKDT